MADNWYYSAEGNAVGPITLDDLRQLVSAGRLGQRDRVSDDGQTWRYVSQVPELHVTPSSPIAKPASPTVKPITTPVFLPSPGGSRTNPVVTSYAIELLRQTSLWVRIMAIVIFVFFGLTVCIGLAMIAFGFMAASSPAGGVPITFGFIYCALAVIYLPPAIYLYRYASRCKSFANIRHENLFEEALAAQKSFWKYVAVVTLLAISVDVLMLAFILLLGSPIVTVHHR